MKQYIVDAFTDEPFHGNPAAVCLLETWLPDKDLQHIAAENNLSETAFLAPVENGYELRWFTPETEVALCGHATLASAYVVLHLLDPQAENVRFFTRSGTLTTSCRGSLIEMVLPLWPAAEIPVTSEMEAAYGARPL